MQIFFSATAQTFFLNIGKILPPKIMAKKKKKDEDSEDGQEHLLKRIELFKLNWLAGCLGFMAYQPL